jgi:hypothetical protein
MPTVSRLTTVMQAKEAGVKPDDLLQSAHRLQYSIGPNPTKRNVQLTPRDALLE